MKLSAIAARLGSSLIPGTLDFEITGIASPQSADESRITFMARKEFRPSLEASRCRAVIVRRGESIPGKVCIETDDPYVAYARVARLFENTSSPWGEGIAPSAIIDPTAEIGPSCSIGPLTVIGPGVKIGTRCILGAHCSIEVGTIVGDDCRIDSGVVIRRNCRIGNRVIIQSNAVIGSEGFGNAREKDTYIRIPCFGTVIIEDDVEIGACTTVDRGNFEPTVIGKGSKLDNLIMVAHNVSIGENTAIAAQSGLAGSTIMGDRVVVAGQAGFVGHIHVGDDSFVGAKSGVTKSAPAGSRITGIPARNITHLRRLEAIQGHLPEMVKEVKRLSRELEILKEEARARDSREKFGNLSD